VFRILNAVMAVVFAASAVLQYNDPDPLPWMLVYGAAAAVSAMGAVRAPKLWQAPAAVGLVALAWAVWILAHLQGGMAWDHIADKMKAGNPRIEESREALGLCIVATWMFVEAVRRRGSHRLARGVLS
jgi:uncharacterized YccA/Bax inhibitor family protein